MTTKRRIKPRVIRVRLKSELLSEEGGGLLTIVGIESFLKNNIWG
jgi:hypothetical protein